MKSSYYVRLRGGQKRRLGYQYRYKEGSGRFTRWLNGDDEFTGVTIPTAKDVPDVQYRAPRIR